MQSTCIIIKINIAYSYKRQKPYMLTLHMVSMKYSRANQVNIVPDDT